jgi:S1-C subfamily serine protease
MVLMMIGIVFSMVGLTPITACHAQTTAPATGQGVPKATIHSLADLFEKVIPTVVVLVVDERMPSTDTIGEETIQRAVGTGFVISEDGLIMTAHHVIELADEIKVKFFDGTTVAGEVTAASPGADVAMVKLKEIPQNLQVAAMADSDTVRTGDAIFIVGSPYFVDFTLSAGHISGRRLQTRLSSHGDPVELLQTDAAVNHGNSGGPMFNMSGQVVGVVSHILTQSGGFEGIGFGVSINTARELLLAQDAVWGGVELYPVSGELAAALNVGQGSGMLVQRVAKNSLAHRMGLKPGTLPVTLGTESFFIGGDVILSINGLQITPKIERQAAVRKLLNELPEGESVTIDVIRAGKQLRLSTAK